MKIPTIACPGFLRTGVFAALFVMTGAASSFAACSVPNPRDSLIFSAFEKYVRENYRIRKGAPHMRFGREFELTYGHALGRLATAVAGDPRRKEAFDCVFKAIDQLAHIRYGLFNTNKIMIGVQEAARGMDNYAVGRYFGVNDDSPLDIVFVMAERLARRGGSRGGGGTGGGGSGGGGGIRPPGGGGKPGLAIVGTNAPCPTTIGSWSLKEAQSHLVRANGLARQLERRFGRGAYCEGDAWYLCRDIKQELFRARDIVNYLFEQNYDGNYLCRMCDYRALLPAARLLRDGVRWTEGRGFQMGANINTAYILENRLNDPLCRASAPPPPSSDKIIDPAVDPGRVTPAHIRAGPDRCFDPKVKVDGEIGGYSFFGGGSVGKLKGEFWCGTRGYARVTRSEITHFRCDTKDNRYTNCKQWKVEPVIDTEVESNKTIYWLRKTPPHKKSWYKKCVPSFPC